MTKIKAGTIVAHPDDCVIFAWPLMRQLKMLDWEIVYLTYQDSDPRAQEISRFWKNYGVSTIFLGYVDDFHDMETGHCSFDIDSARQSIQSHVAKYDLVLTHNKDGDYGHLHHQFVHECVASCAVDQIYFASTHNEDYVVECDEHYDVAQLPLHRPVIEGFTDRHIGRYQTNYTWTDETNVAKNFIKYWSERND